MKKYKKFISLVFFIVAIGLAYMGYSESQTIGSSIAGVVSGGPTDSVVLKYILSVVLVLAGILMLKK